MTELEILKRRIMILEETLESLTFALTVHNPMVRDYQTVRQNAVTYYAALDKIKDQPLPEGAF